MDSRTSFQDVIRCDLCEKEIATMYCDFCYVNLCTSCIGKHIFDDYNKHKVVPLQKRKTTLIYPKCTIHPTKCCEFHCRDCNLFVCSLCTTICDRHKGHNISTSFEIYNAKREVIGKDTKELENIISPTYEEISAELESQIANLDEVYEKLTKAVLQHGEEWHREIDSILNKVNAEIIDMKMKHMIILKTHLEEIKQIQNLIKQTKININRIEETNKVIVTMEYSSKNKEFRKLPSKVQVISPTFSPKTFYKQRLYQMFGYLIPLSTIKEENGYKFKESNSTTKELLKEVKLITSISTGYKNLRSVTCHNKEILTSGRDANNIKCFNMKGSSTKTIQIISVPWPNDMAVTRDGDLLYSAGGTRTVYQVKNGKTEEVIRLKGWVPSNLCVTSSGDLLVTMYSVDETLSKVVRYLGFIETQTIQLDHEGKPLYSGNDKIKYITENRNLDICVADYGASAVVVVNQIGKLRFRYTGHPSNTKDKPFKPFGMITDCLSQILIADCNNHCIHILDKDGQFLSYIDNCDLKDPYGLCVDKTDALFVAEYSTGNVKKIKYLE